MKQFEIVIPTERGNAEFERVYDIMLDKCKAGSVMYAKHPQDELAHFEHWHVGGQTKSDNTAETIAKWFGYPPNSVEKIKSHFKTYAVYLAHKTKDAIEAGKSAPLDIGGTFDYNKAITDYETRGKTTSIIDDILSGKITEYELNTDTDLMGAIIRQGLYNKVKSALATFQNAESVRRMTGEKDIQVCWICGLAGVGKTVLAKQMAGKRPYYITSSGKNPFDNYLGQPVVIIDDIEKDTATGKALLKLLDPHTDTLTACRYNNKLITADMIIVTSTITATTWWAENATKTDGNRFQLLRRLTLGEWLLGDGKGKMELVFYDANGYEFARQTAEFPEEILKKRNMDTKETRVKNASLMLTQLGVSIDAKDITINTDGFKDIDPEQLDIADIWGDMPSIAQQRRDRTAKDSSVLPKPVRKTKPPKKAN